MQTIAHVLLPLFDYRGVLRDGKVVAKLRLRKRVARRDVRRRFLAVLVDVARRGPARAACDRSQRQCR